MISETETQNLKAAFQAGLAKVYISNDYGRFAVPAQYAHLARNWEEVRHDAGPIIWVQYAPVSQGSRHYHVSRRFRSQYGIWESTSTRYLTLDNAIRAALRAAAN